MSESGIGDLLAIGAVLSSAASAILSYSVRLALLEAKLSIAEGRREDQKSIREWINGSFMRASEAQARLDAIEDVIREHMRESGREGRRGG